MSKKVIKLTENELNRVIKESVDNLLKEYYNNAYEPTKLNHDKKGLSVFGNDVYNIYKEKENEKISNDIKQINKWLTRLEEYFVENKTEEIKETFNIISMLIENLKDNIGEVININ